MAFTISGRAALESQPSTPSVSSSVPIGQPSSTHSPKVAAAVQNAFTPPAETCKRKRAIVPISSNTPPQLKAANVEDKLLSFDVEGLLELPYQQFYPIASRAMLEMVERIDDPEQKNNILYSIVKKQVYRHLQLALQAIEKIQTVSHNHYMHEIALRALAMACPVLFRNHDPLSWIHQIPKGARDGACSEMAIALATENPEQAQAYVAEIQGAISRDHALAFMAEEQAVQNVELALETISRISDTVIKNDALAEILPLQGQVNFKQAFDNCTTLIQDDEDFQQKALVGIYLQSAPMKDQEAASSFIKQALSAAQKIEEDAERDEALCGIAAAQAFIDTDGSIRTIHLINSTSWKDEARSRICSTLAQNNFRAALTFARQITENSKKDRILCKIAAANPGEALHVVSLIRDNRMKTISLQKVVKRTALTDPTNALQIARTIQDPLQKVIAICKAAKRQPTAQQSLVSEIIQEAIETANSMNPGKQKDKCIHEIVKIMVSFDPYQALDRCSLITNNKIKAEAFCMLAEALMKAQPQEAYGIFRLALLTTCFVEDNLTKIELLNCIVAALPGDVETEEGKA